MKPASPDSSIPPAQPTSEAWALRAEWREEPPSLARDEAGRALEALAKAAGETAGAVSADDDVPPVPDDLRSRWTGAYGRPAEAVERCRPEQPPVDDRRAQGVSDWLASLFHPRRAAWAGGAGAVVTALVMMLSQDGAGPASGALSEPGPRLRGQGAVAGVEPALIALIDPSSAGAAGEEVLAVVRQAFPGRDLRVLAGAHEAAAVARSEPRLVVVNLASGLVTAWSGGELVEEFPPSAGAATARVIGQIESADESLEKSLAAP